MAPPLVAIRLDGKLEIHFPDATANYVTLCQMDGDDPKLNMYMGDLPSGAKVTCAECIAIFDVCAQYTEKDIRRGRRRKEA